MPLSLSPLKKRVPGKEKEMAKSQKWREEQEEKERFEKEEKSKKKAGVA